MSTSPRQLRLAISLQEATRFSNFVDLNGINSEPVSALRSLAGTGVFAGGLARNMLIWGGQASGLSHLLQAVCHDAVAEGLKVQYLPLADLLDYPPEAMCEGLELLDIVCVDDIEACAGIPAWEEALFDLFNRVRDAQGCFLGATHTSPQELPIELSDLVSRLRSGPSFYIAPLDDSGCKRALMQRAAAKGLGLSDEVGEFIMNHAPRDARTLFQFLEVLDERSLQEQRKLTVPFVRSVLHAL